MAPGEAKRMDSRGDIHAVAQHGFVRKHHVAQVDSDAQLQGVVLQRGLSCKRAVHGVQSAMEARQRTVADLADHPPVEPRQYRAQEFAMILQGPQSLALVAAHDRGVARDVAEHDRGQLAGWI